MIEESYCISPYDSHIVPCDANLDIEMGHNKLIKDINLKLKEIDDLKAEMAMLDKQIQDKLLVIEGMKNALKYIPKEPQTNRKTTLRAGSDPEKTRLLLLKSPTPLHIGDIVAGIGKENTKELRASLGSSLSAYVKKKQIFSKPAPNTFGLLEKTYAENDDDII